MRMSNKKYILGIDVGATSVKIGLVNNSGTILSRAMFYTKAFALKDTFIKELIRQMRSILNAAGITENELAGIGIGLPGRVDYKKGIVHDLTNIKGWNEVPLKNILHKFFKTSIYLDNDANAFASGQLIWGKARSARNAICVTLGSGVGGGLIIEGKVFRGSNFSAGEIGHVCIDINGPACGCGANGCLEAFVGNRYITRRAIEKIKKGQKTLLTKLVKGNLRKITPETITRAARQKDIFSIKLWEEIGTCLGIGLSGIVNIINPDRVIIGGGLSKAEAFIFKPLNRELKKRAMRQHLKVLKVQKSDFNDDAGIIGAASLLERER